MTPFPLPQTNELDEVAATYKSRILEAQNELEEFQRDRLTFETTINELKMHKKVLHKEIELLESTIHAENERKQQLILILQRNGYTMEDVLDVNREDEFP